MKKQISLAIFMTLAACTGTVTEVTSDDAPASETVDANSVFLFGTDYASSGQLYQTSTADDRSLDNSGVTGLGSDATLRHFDGNLYVLHSGYSIGSSDNIQIIDPSNSFTTTAQWSTGNGTNPHDIVVDENGLAFISLYDAASDSENLDDSGNPGDVIIMDTSTGEITSRLSFFDNLTDDGDRNAKADQMVQVGDTLYVCLQDLSSFFEQDSAGKIGIIDMATQTVTGVITLQGRNPVDVVYNEGTNSLFVALQAPYDFTLGDFDTSQAFGGVEIVPLDDTSSTTLINDEDLGGYIERLADASWRIFVVASDYDPTDFSFSSRVVQLTATDTTETSTLVDDSYDIREIAVDANDQLWIARRTINADDGSASDPQIDVLNPDTGETIGNTLNPEVPVVSIVFGE